MSLSLLAMFLSLAMIYFSIVFKSDMNINHPEVFTILGIVLFFANLFIYLFILHHKIKLEKGE